MIPDSYHCWPVGWVAAARTRAQQIESNANNSICLVRNTNRDLWLHMSSAEGTCRKLNYTFDCHLARSLALYVQHGILARTK